MDPLTIAVPERVCQCRCYLDNGRLVGTGELTLANWTRATADVTGAGFSGTISTPTRGNFESAQATFATRVYTPELMSAFAPGVHDLEFRAVIQGLNSMSQAVEQNFSAFMRVLARGITSGTISNSNEMGCSAEFEVLQETRSLNGIVLCRFDKINNIAEIRASDGTMINETLNINTFLGV